MPAHQCEEFSAHHAKRELFGDNDAAVFLPFFDVVNVREDEILNIEADQASLLLYGISKLRIVGEAGSLHVLGIDSIEPSSCQRLGKAGVHVLVQEKPDLHLPVQVDFG